MQERWIWGLWNLQWKTYIGWVTTGGDSFPSFCLVLSSFFWHALGYSCLHPSQWQVLLTGRHCQQITKNIASVACRVKRLIPQEVLYKVDPVGRTRSRVIALSVYRHANYCWARTMVWYVSWILAISAHSYSTPFL